MRPRTSAPVPRRALSIANGAAYNRQMQYLLYALIGAAAGILGGFVGLGGGVVIIPALIYFCGYDQLKAQGTSLAILLPPIGILAFLQYWNNPKVQIDLLAAGIIAAAFIIGGFFGGKWANLLDVNLVRKAFAVLLMVSALQMFLKR
jgi:uncharacterized protein